MNGKRMTIRNSDGSVSQPTDLQWAEALEKLADYEDAEEEGRMLLLPCKVEDLDLRRTSELIAADELGRVIILSQEETERAAKGRRRDG